MAKHGSLLKNENGGVTTRMPSSTEWAYFGSGALLPTMLYYYYYYCHVLPLRSKKNRSSSSSSPPTASTTRGSESRRLVPHPPPDDDDGAPPPQASATTTAPPNNQNDDEDDEETDSDDDDDEEEDDEDATTPAPGMELSCASWNIRHAPYKMMLVVNQELGMGKGKIAAQCGHAAVGCYQRALRQCPNALRAWNKTGCAKIAVKCPTTHDLETLAAVAQSLGIPHYLVEDAGRTQIAAGSRTVLGLFGPAFVFEGVTDHLKLM